MQTAALLTLLGLLAAPLALAGPAVPAAAPGNGPRLTPEQVIGVALDGLMEVGANDFRLSDMGQDETYDAADPAVAYNSTDNEYLVVWWGSDNTPPLAQGGEVEIFGQRLGAGYRIYLPVVLRSVG